MQTNAGSGKGINLAVAGGGTGGHVYPALAVVAEVGRLLAEDGRRQDLALLYVGTRGGMEEAIVERQGLAFRGIASGPLRGKGLARVPVNLGRMVWGFGQSLAALRRSGAQALLATGGYVCVPVVLAAWASRIPVLIYLPDVEPGWAIRFLSRFASCVAVTSGESRRFLATGRVVETGYPVRPELGDADRAEARLRLGLEPDLPTLLIAGGSRGARALNVAVGEALEKLLEGTQVVHASGTADEPWLRQRRATLPEGLQGRYRLHDYLHEEFVDALSAADLAISRSGASVLGEYPAVGLPSVLVPYPYAGAHQRLNAEWLAQKGAAVVLDNERLGELLPTVQGLLGDRGRLEAMAEAARKLARPRAARHIGELLLEMAGAAGTGGERAK